MGFFSRSRSSDTNGSVDQNNVSADASPSSVRTFSRKEKKKAAKEQQLSKNISDEGSLFDGEQQQPSEERFLPLALERPFWCSDSDQDHNYLYFEKHVVLGLEQVNRLVDIVCEELCSRGGLDTPFIFSSLALDIKANAVKRLIKAFLGTCVVLVGRDKDVAEKNWREEARFADMHELGMCLRWGLARIVRIIDGVEVRGLLSWEYYIPWAEQEQALNYPPEHFRIFLPTLQTPLRLILLRILSLLARLTAHSATSGHTPPTLSPLFGPLIFGLGPSGLPFNHTYTSYLRSVNAVEHILLAFIRWQNTPDATGNYSNILTGGTASALGVPPRLKEWIKGYPAMLDTSSNYRFSPASSPEQRHRPRKGARTVRVTSVRRNVKAYDKDLVKTAATWGDQPTSGNATPSSSPNGGFSSSYEWVRISPPSYGYDTSRLPPKYSDAYRKRLNLPNSSPDTSYKSSLTPPIDFNSPPLSALTSKTAFTFGSDSQGDLYSSSGSLTGRIGTERDYKSLTDEKWGNFEYTGFGGDESTEKKLQFDLTESARAARSIKRETLDWSSFSSSGFSRSDTPLQTALQLTVPPQLNLSTSLTPLNSPSSPNPSPPITPSESRKLKKKGKNGAPTFSWDVEPVLGPEQIIEEAFLDVYCDLLRGSGWSEALHSVISDNRPCNWALVEFKALPSENADHPQSEEYNSDSDPRTSTSLLLFEEYVPGEYREQLATLRE
ncbi:hypothetical protein DFH05DRAFT_500906 [Lentinula detonsa]|uniref:Meiotically up-regulated protein Msb1/Mug8 domain-containing protein n=1 Tax=Lentinula detonsa TaxID=2804962 RepID=A0A9W8NS27_9AGAR|nr:hypothetical protein DFH05DRAFT_500906 [Lentinula detonsa]